MSRGEPGLPAGFVWRDREYRVIRLVRRWKQLKPESGSKELYLRRHYAEAVMDDGATWVVYCLRQPHGAGGTGGRWFIYSIAAKEASEPPSGNDGPESSPDDDGPGSPGGDPDATSPTSS